MSKDFILEFIDAYRELPCLWKTTDADYHDKFKRDAAIEKLLQVFRTRYENATKEMVTKKIASMRSSFRKELNKVRASERSGCGAGEVHNPKLWYYNSLQFLMDQEEPRRSISIQSALNRMRSDGEEDLDDPEETAVASTSQSAPPTLKRPRAQIADQLLEKISKKLDGDNRQQYDSLGAHVAEKMRGLPPDMACYCEKVIFEALLLAQLGQLSLTSTVTCGEVQEWRQDENAEEQS